MGYLASGKVKARSLAASLSTPQQSLPSRRPSSLHSHTPPTLPIPHPQVIFIDTFHLFPETIQFLRRLEAAFGFKAETFHIVDCATKAEYDAKYGADLWKKDIDQYDKMCKVLGGA